jgi:hypothetical protein
MRGQVAVVFAICYRHCGVAGLRGCLLSTSTCDVSRVRERKRSEILYRVLGIGIWNSL